MISSEFPVFAHSTKRTAILTHIRASNYPTHSAHISKCRCVAPIPHANVSENRQDLADKHLAYRSIPHTIPYIMLYTVEHESSSHHSHARVCQQHRMRIIGIEVKTSPSIYKLIAILNWQSHRPKQIPTNIPTHFRT